jgi:hypothetical protein
MWLFAAHRIRCSAHQPPGIGRPYEFSGNADVFKCADYIANSVTAEIVIAVS